MANPGSIKIPIEIHMTWNEEPALWPESDYHSPTPLQRVWGKVFLGLWYLVDSVGAGGGKTWFWKRVIAFIELQDPRVKE